MPQKSIFKFDNKIFWLKTFYAKNSCKKLARKLERLKHESD